MAFTTKEQLVPASRLVRRRHNLAPLQHTRSLDSALVEVRPPASIIGRSIRQFRHARSIDQISDSFNQDEPRESSQGNNQRESGQCLAHLRSRSKESDNDCRPKAVGLDVSGTCLRKVSLFQGCDASFLHELATKLRKARFPAGHIFYKQGDLDTAMYIVEQGKVSLIECDECVAVLETGAVFGDMEAMDISQTVIRRRATVKATTKCNCCFIERDKLWSLLNEFHAERQIILCEMARRLTLLPVGWSVVEFSEIERRELPRERYTGQWEEFGPSQWSSTGSASIQSVNSQQESIVCNPSKDAFESELSPESRVSLEVEIDHIGQTQDIAHCLFSSGRNPSKQSVDSQRLSLRRNPSKESIKSESSSCSSQSTTDVRQQTPRRCPNQSTDLWSSSRNPSNQSTDKASKATRWQRILGKCQRQTVVQCFISGNAVEFRPVVGG